MESMGARPRRIFPHASSTSRGAMLGFGMVTLIYRYDARRSGTMYRVQGNVLVEGHQRIDTGYWCAEVYRTLRRSILRIFAQTPRYKSSQQMATIAVTKIKPNNHFWFVRFWRERNARLLRKLMSALTFAIEFRGLPTHWGRSVAASLSKSRFFVSKEVGRSAEKCSFVQGKLSR